MATSGTVSTTVTQTIKVIDHAFRKCGKVPQQVVSEDLQVAKELLYFFLSTLANKGIALWAIQKHIFPMYQGEQTVVCPLGTVDMLNANFRTLQRVTGTATSTEGVAANAFDGDLDTACIQTTPAGYIQVQYAEATTICNFGLMPNSTGVWDIEIQASNDGSTWVTVYEDEEFEALLGKWTWFDIEGLIPYVYFRLQANGATVLNVTEFVTANMPNEIPLYKMSRDEYSNLPDKFFQGQPVQYWYDKQINQPLMVLWPAPQLQFTFAQIVVYTQRYIQDIGTLSQEIEIPQRWYLAIISELARLLSMSIKDVAEHLKPVIANEAKFQLQSAWDSETDSSPVRLQPNISPYTR